MTVDTDLATLRNPWGLMPDVVTAAADRVEAELSRLRHAESQARYYREKYEERAEELEIELATLRRGRTKDQGTYAPNVEFLAALDRVEAELARLREGLRRIEDLDGTYVDVANEAKRIARALLADTPEDGAEPVEHRENIVEVYDHRGRYLGCMGIETWRRLLAEDGA